MYPALFIEGARGRAAGVDQLCNVLAEALWISNGRPGYEGLMQFFLLIYRKRWSRNFYMSLWNVSVRFLKLVSNWNLFCTNVFISKLMWWTRSFEISSNRFSRFLVAFNWRFTCFERCILTFQGCIRRAKVAECYELPNPFQNRYLMIDIQFSWFS